MKRPTWVTQQSLLPPQAPTFILPALLRLSPAPSPDIKLVLIPLAVALFLFLPTDIPDIANIRALVANKLFPSIIAGPAARSRVLPVPSVTRVPRAPAA